MPRLSAFFCALCRSELEEGTKNVTCMHCGKQEQGRWLCFAGHYTCSTCRVLPARDIVETTCTYTRSQDPIEIAEMLMSHPAFSDHGPEHHLLVAPAALTALANSRGRPIDIRQLRTALQRLMEIPGGACGSWGNCGACVGSGVTVAVLLNANFKADRERSLAIEATATSLNALAAMRGQRCCKESVYTAITSLGAIIARELKISLAIKPFKCIFAGKIPDCKKGNCIYFKRT